MRKLLFSLGLLAGCGLLYAQSPLYISEFSGGIRNNVDATRIADNEVADAENVLFDDDATGKTRGGMIKSNSTALGSADDRNIYSQFEYRRSDGSSYHIVHASTSLYYSLGSADFTQFDLDVSSTYPMNYTVFMDTLAYCNGVTGTGVMTWDTNTTSTHTLTYSPKYITTYQNRLVIGGMANAPSTVRFSGFQNPSDWTVGTDVSTAPVSFSINTQDGQNVVGFFWSPNGNLGVLKEKSVWEIGGYDTSDFYQRLVIADIGCTDLESVCYREGVVYWLSSEGIVGYDGKSYSIVSDKIQGTIDEVQQLHAGSGTLSKNTVTDWDIFSSSNNVATSDNGRLNLNEFIDGSYNTAESYIIKKDTTTTRYVIVKGIFNPQYGIYFSSDNLNFPSMTSIDDSQNIDYSVPKFSGNFFKIDGNNKMWVAYAYGKRDGSNYPCYDVKIASKTFSDTSWSTRTVTTAYYIDWSGSRDYNQIGISMDLDNNGNPFLIYTKKTAYTGGSSGLYSSSYTATSNSFSETYYNNSNISFSDLGIKDTAFYTAYVYPEIGGTSYSHLTYSSGTCSQMDKSSTTILESHSTSGLTPYIAFYSPNIKLDSSGYPHIAYIDSADKALEHRYFNGTNWLAVQTVDDLSAFNCVNGSLKMCLDGSDNVYILYNTTTDNDGELKLAYQTVGTTTWDTKVIKDNPTKSYSLSISTGINDYPWAVWVDNVDNSIYLAREATGYFQSEVHTTNFSSGYLNQFITEDLSYGDNIYYYYRTSSTVAGLANESYTTLTPNASVSGDISNYIQCRIEFSTNTIIPSYTPSYIDSFLLGYRSSEGSQGLSSMIYDGRLWFGVSVSSATCLDKTLIYDSNNAWAKFSSSKNTLNFLNLNGMPYMGSDDGYIYRLDTGSSDDGNAIDAYVLTKQYDLGAIAYQKSMKNLFLVALETGDWDLNLDYYIDKSATATESFTVDLDSADLINYKVPLAKHPRFYTIQYKLYNNTANQPFSFMSIYTQLEGYPIR